MSEREIAKRVGLSQSSVSRIIKQALLERRQQNADELRALEGQRVEELHRALWPAALKGNIGAANIVLKAADRRARLFGLDEGGEGGAGARYVASIWIEAFVADRDAMPELLAEAEPVGLQAAQATDPSATVDAAVTSILWMDHRARLGEVPVEAYKGMLAAAARGETIGI